MALAPVVGMIETDDFILMDDQRHVGLTPSSLTAPLSPDEILAVFALSDYANCCINQKAVQHLVEYVNRTQDGHAQDVPFVIAERIDASMELAIADDAMTVKAILITAQGGKHIGLPKLIDKLHEAKVSFGLQTQRTLQFLKAAAAAEPGIRMEEIIAVGRPAENGRNARFKRLVSTPKERLLKPQPIDKHRVDMRDLGQMCSVRAGDELMRKLPLSLGKDGKNVYGEVLPSISGEDAVLVAGDRTIISPDDPNLLIAADVGLPMEIEHGMRVDEVLAMKEVNVGTGHIDFAGSIVISGDVREEMKVTARGDIHVLGYVDSAYLKSGGDILVEKGIIGHRRPNGQISCVLKADGSIHARNAQYSQLTAGKDINITRELSHCLVRSLQSVFVGDEKGFRGLLVGGEFNVGDRLESVIVGSEAGPNTYILVEGEYERLYERRRALQQRCEKIQFRLDELMEVQIASTKIPEEGKRIEMQSKVAATIQHDHVLMAQSEAEITEIQKAIDAYLSHSRFIAKKQMYPNVHFKLAGQEVVSERVYGPSQAVFIEGELKFEPL